MMTTMVIWHRKVATDTVQQKLKKTDGVGADLLDGQNDWSEEKTVWRLDGESETRHTLLLDIGTYARSDVAGCFLETDG